LVVAQKQETDKLKVVVEGRERGALPSASNKTATECFTRTSASAIG